MRWWGSMCTGSGGRMGVDVGVVTIGNIERGLVAWLVRRLTEEMGGSVAFVAALPLPRSAYDPKRGQFRGEAILRLLRDIPLVDAERVVAVVGADCYAGRLNFVFGLAALEGRESLVALPYLCSNYNSRRPSQGEVYERVLKEALHELGHTRGLRHCENPTCVMYFSNTLSDTDRKSHRYCESCKRKLVGAAKPTI
ncbi:MAG: archaemetzincin family Zn-dependent metalloprotease [Chitinivibrionales bacterium]|nr:archaemetzincin family Zn-dependent metalloprotease [Chitinivibrionales bacterium]